MKVILERRPRHGVYIDFEDEEDTSERITITCTPRLKKILQRTSKATKISVSSIIRMCIAHAMPQLFGELWDKYKNVQD